MTVPVSASASPPRALRFVVRGKVQGVFFRAATLRKAEHLGLDGWVRNMADGSVEVVGLGSAAALSELAGWLWEGSTGSRVERVDVEHFDAELTDSGFSIR